MFLGGYMQTQTLPRLTQETWLERRSIKPDQTSQIWLTNDPTFRNDKYKLNCTDRDVPLQNHETSWITWTYWNYRYQERSILTCAACGSPILCIALLPCCALKPLPLSSTAEASRCWQRMVHISSHWFTFNMCHHVSPYCAALVSCALGIIYPFGPARWSIMMNLCWSVLMTFSHMIKLSNFVVRRLHCMYFFLIRIVCIFMFTEL